VLVPLAAVAVLEAPLVDRYGEQRDEEPERLYHGLFDGTRSGSFRLLRDLQDLS
jgi:hypothetical protein